MAGAGRHCCSRRPRVLVVVVVVVVAGEVGAVGEVWRVGGARRRG